MEALDYLRETPLFAGVAADALAGLAAAASIKEYPAGHTVLRRGETVDGLFVLVTGRVAVTAKHPAKGQVLLAELGAGEVFGETSIVERGIAGAAVKCAADTRVVFVPQEAFRQLLVADEIFAVRVNTLIRSRKPASAPAAA